MEIWNLALAAVFFCAMGVFTGVAALYLTSTPFRPLGHQAAEIVLFCLLFAIALFAVIALFRPHPTREEPRDKSELPIGDSHRRLARTAPAKNGVAVPPVSLTDAELDEFTSLAAAVPIEHRDAFLETVAGAVAEAVGKYPEVGVGLIHREGARLQRYYLEPPPDRRGLLLP